MFAKSKWIMLKEFALRAILWLLFLYTDYWEPFVREIQREEIWKYKYPVTDSYIPAFLLWIIIFTTPTIFFIFEFLSTRKCEDFHSAFLGISLSYCLNAFITTFLKAIVGRPRPDFYYRCFPDGKGDDYKHCTGLKRSYMDGRKSFPSGHASFSFACMMFISLYLIRKYELFKNKGQSWHLCLCLVPLMTAAGIAISRTCDYHHHYEDVAFGSLLGSTLSYICFNLYFPDENLVQA